MQPIVIRETKGGYDMLYHDEVLTRGFKTLKEALIAANEVSDHITFIPLEGYKRLNMTQRGSNLKKIRDACIKANPSCIGREPGLADVLLAIGEKDTLLSVDTAGGFHYGYENQCVWNLHENLSGQEDSTLEFISSLVA